MARARRAERELAHVDGSSHDASPPRRRLRACESFEVAATTGALANWLEGEHARRALSLWPRLARRRLRRCHDDPNRIAVLVADRTALPYESIVKLLVKHETVESDPVNDRTRPAEDWSPYRSEPRLISGFWATARLASGTTLRTPG